MSQRNIPEKVIAISPWANATFFHEGEKEYMQGTQEWDGLCLKSHSMFGRMFVGNNPNVDFTSDPFVNIEKNFETKMWQDILKKCSVMITYGSDELLSFQNKILAKKMSDASEDVTTLPPKMCWSNTKVIIRAQY